MCILVLCLNAHPHFPLIILNNRDEYVSRASPCDIYHRLGVICGVDPRARNPDVLRTWFGLNYRSGRFVSLTNVGDFSGSGSRGRVVSDLLQHIDENSEDQFHRHAGFVSPTAPGYNIVWGNCCADETTGDYENLVFYLTSSRFPQLGDVRELRGDGVYVVGNDVPGDEFVKVPFLKGAIESELHRLRDVQDPEVLRDALAVVMRSRQSSMWPNWPVVAKFLTWRWAASGIPRRMQPGTRTCLLAAVFFLVVSFFVLGGLRLLTNLSISLRTVTLAVIVDVLLGVALGWLHHAEMQNIFISLRSFLWGTVAQTIVMTQKSSGLTFYSYCDTRSFVECGRAGGGLKWDRFVADLGQKIAKKVT